jgi:hypothetical protein
MPSELNAVTYPLLVVFVVASGFVAYTAIAISRTLSNRVYRNQALGLAAVAIVLVIVVIWGTLSFSSNYVLTGIENAIQLLGTWFAFFIGFYYFIDASIGAARLTDPLFRDTLHWTRVRLAFWAYDIGAAILFTIAAAVGSYNYGNGGSLTAFFQAGIPVLIILYSGAVALPVAIRRSKDKVLKRQLSWFAIWMVCFVIFFIGAYFINNAAAAPAGLVVFLAGAYPLYRSTTSLVPLYRFETSSRVPVQPTTGDL